MKKIIIALIILCSINVKAQKNKLKTIDVNVSIKYDSLNVVLDSNNYLLPKSNDSVVFSNIKFYLSNFHFTKNRKKVFTEKNSFHLVDIKNSNSLLIKIKVPVNLSFDSMHFNLGIDSFTNAKGVGNADLDPIKGMYWTWHSGYINCKIEGRSNVCLTRNNAFEFHLGGFLNGFNAVQKISLATAKNKINLCFDINKFLSQINLAETNMIMTPGKKTVELSEKMNSCFLIK